ncbi:hypothetical protein MKX03_001436 [Papaver bracteatum]|nr:hypothetical protein MKX03_001436 [Papaver bracteatum]
MKKGHNPVFFFLNKILPNIYVLNHELGVHIVYLGDLPSESEYSPMSHHQNILQEIIDEGRSVQDILVHTYKRSFNGFSAKLTDEEVQKLSGMEGIVSVFPNHMYQLHTTRSWDFLGLSENVNRIPFVESDTIIGVIDSGIWPESASFSGDGLGPPPEKWKGTCNGGHNFTCNNKLIGARYYVTDSEGSARDTYGHAGNKGPYPKTVVSNAPWLLTVAETSTDRRIIDRVILGNGMVIQGLGVNGTLFPLLYGDDVSTTCNPLLAKRCYCLNKNLVKGKLILCNGATDIVTREETLKSGALGTIMVLDSDTDPFNVSYVYPLPASSINVRQGEIVKSYLNSTM